MAFWNYLSGFFTSSKASPQEKDEFCTQIEEILGCDCKDISFYKEAFSVKGSSKEAKNRSYERLEFLGDAVLGSIISSHVFINYPQANEGFLTQLKSKIVNRKNLNQLGESLNILKFINIEYSKNLGENIHGNLFEAFVGAIYLDLGYDACEKIVLEKLLTPEKINQLENKIVSYKSLLLEWGQKKKKIIRYSTVEEIQPNRNIVFRSCVYLDDKMISNATESSKKKAEEKAAQRAFYMLNKKQNILESAKTSA